MVARPQTGEVSLDVQIQGVARTCLLDTGSEVSLFSTGLVPPETETRSVSGQGWAANGSEMGVLRLEAQIGPRRFAVNLVWTSQVEFLILGKGCLQDLELLWHHLLNEWWSKGTPQIKEHAVGPGECPLDKAAALETVT